MTRRVLGMNYTALEKAEEMYCYKHIPVVAKSSLPKAEEVWQVIDGELELVARYGKPIFCGI